MITEDGYEFLDIVGEIDESYIDRALRPWKKKKVRWFTYHWGRKVAACVAMLLLLTVTSPVAAGKIPFVGSIFTYLHDKLSFAGEYQDYSSEMLTSVECNGITLTVKEVYCDGENLYLSYLLTSEIPFADYGSDNYLEKYLDFEGKLSINADEGEYQLDDYGSTGIEGEFLDEYTYAGADMLGLVQSQVSDTFTYVMQVDRWMFYGTQGQTCEMQGDWKLSIPVQVNNKDVKVIYLPDESTGIEKVVVTPVLVTIYTPNKAETSQTVLVYSETSGDLEPQTCYGNSQDKLWIPRSEPGDWVDIYVVDLSKCTVGMNGTYTKREIKEHAISSLRIDLQ